MGFLICESGGASKVVVCCFECGFTFWTLGCRFAWPEEVWLVVTAPETKDGVYCFGLANGCSELGLLILVASLDARVQFKRRSGVPSDCWLSTGSEGFMFVK